MGVDVKVVCYDCKCSVDIGKKWVGINNDIKLREPERQYETKLWLFLQKHDYHKIGLIHDNNDCYYEGWPEDEGILKEIANSMLQESQTRTVGPSEDLPALTDEPVGPHSITGLHRLKEMGPETQGVNANVFLRDLPDPEKLMSYQMPDVVLDKSLPLLRDVSLTKPQKAEEK